MTDHDYAPNLDHVLEDIEAGRNYTEWIVDRARPYLHGRVLDAGAGTGTFTEAVALSFAVLVMQKVVGPPVQMALSSEQLVEGVGPSMSA